MSTYYEEVEIEFSMLKWFSFCAHHVHYNYQLTLNFNSKFVRDFVFFVYL